MGYPPCLGSKSVSCCGLAGLCEQSYGVFSDDALCRLPKLLPLLRGEEGYLFLPREPCDRQGLYLSDCLLLAMPGLLRIDSASEQSVMISDAVQVIMEVTKLAPYCLTNVDRIY